MLHYTFSIEDLALIRQRRRNANRFGFAVHLAYLRFPGRVLGPSETPPAHLLAFIADQLRVNPKAFADYAQRDETRREHLAELQAYLGMRPFGRQDYRTMARIASNESTGTDRGDAIVGAMVVHLRQQSILLPSAAVLEKIALVARAPARKQAYKALTAGVDQAVREKLDALIQVAENETRTAFAANVGFSNDPARFAPASQSRIFKLGKTPARALEFTTLIWALRLSKLPLSSPLSRSLRARPKQYQTPCSSHQLMIASRANRYLPAR